MTWDFYPNRHRDSGHPEWAGVALILGIVAAVSVLMAVIGRF